MRRLSSWSIRNPVPTVVLFLLLIVAGIAGYLTLRINNTPDLDVPAILVTVAQPGAAPSEMETQVTRLIEDSVAGLGGVKHIRSTVNDGLSVTTVEFQLGTDTDRATNDVRNAVTGVRPDLPADVEEPVVERIDASGGQLVTYVVRAAGMSPEEISWFVDNDVAKALLAVPGVSRVERAGGVTREIRVRLDPDRLAALGITAGEVSRQLRLINANLPGGRSDIGSSEQSIRTLGSAVSVRDLAASLINLPDGRTVRLADLGKVEDSWAEPRTRARFDGQEVVGFGIIRTRGASEVHTAEAVREAVARLDASRDDVSMQEVTSADEFVQESYLASLEALLLGALLAVIVVWWFLRDARATFISALAMPLSLIPTFAVMALFDQSFNIVTLLALALTVGILVDDAIVEIENIVRHMRAGKPAYPAAIEAADEIGLAVVATTMTIVAVFAPVGFMPGIVGQFFRAFAISACVSVLFSLLVARTITPLMGAYLLRGGDVRHDEPRWMPRYLEMVSWALDHRIKVVLSGFVLVSLSVGMAALMKFDFVPSSDTGRSVMSVELPPGATLAETDAAVARLSEILRQRSEVESIYAALGTSITLVGPGGGGTTQGEVRRAILTVNLVPRGDRDLTQQEFEADIGPSLLVVPGVRVRFGADGSSGSKLQIALVSDDPEALTHASRQLEREMRSLPGFNNVASTANLARPEILITPKPDKAASLGVATQTIAQAVRIATLGDVDVNLPKYNLSNRQIPIRLMLVEEARRDLDTLRNLRLPTGQGGSVPLSSVAEVSFGAGPSQIDRLDRRRNALIEAELAGIPLGEANEMVRGLPAMRNLPPTVFEVPTGDVENLGELLTGFIFAFVTGILLMYFVLVLLFRNFGYPITILTALPLSFGGAFGLLLILGKPFSVPVLIGILMLMGIAAKNSILLVEYAIVSREERGATRREALLDAAHKRARPIIMTTLAMGAGMLPIAAGIGADTEFRAPMAIAVIGGLITSTLLSLIYVPVVFTLVDDAHAWLARHLSRATLGSADPKAEIEDARLPPHPGE
jgi:HAE1 family hydrophobic/amphiphilic exporter-1